MKDTQKEQLRAVLRKIIELTSTVDPRDNSVWGNDTDCGNIESLVDDAEKLINEWIES